jgi:hypothetical protein
MGLSPRDGGGHGYARILEAATELGETVEQATLAESPLVLAVAQVGEVAPSEKLIDVLESQPKLISSVRPLPVAGGKPPTSPWAASEVEKPVAYRSRARALLDLAGDLGADALLLVGGTVDLYHLSTGWSWLNLGLVTMLFVPSERIEAEAVGSYTLLDVESGSVLDIGTRQAVEQRYTCEAYREQNTAKMARDLRDRLLAEMGREVIEKLSGSISVATECSTRSRSEAVGTASGSASCGP